MESQARPSRVLRAAAESAATDDATRAAAYPPATDRAAGPEPDLGARLHDGDALRRPPRALLTIIDEGNREGLEIAMGVSLPSRRVVRVLNELVTVHGRPAAVRVDNGLSQKSRTQSFAGWRCQ